MSAYGFITEGHSRFSDHYYDRSWKKMVFYINHDFGLERALWRRLHEEGIIRLYQRPEEPPRSPCGGPAGPGRGHCPSVRPHHEGRP